MRAQTFSTLQYLTHNWRQSKRAYYTIAALLVAAMALTIVSWLRICSEACADSHSYRLFGLTFEDVGMVFFPIMLLMHLLSRRLPLLGTLAAWALAATLGAEAMFIYLQKYIIGHWCPVCLLIATTLLLGAAIYFYGYYVNFKNILIRREKELVMINVTKGCVGMIAMAVGFVLAFTGIAKHSELQAEENSVVAQIAFGKANSQIEVYVFTDWECPACRSLEGVFEAMAPAIMQRARLTFVDDPVHAASLNFTPYNLSFMIYNKANYFALRNALSNLSETTKAPTQEQVAALAAKQGVKFTQLSYADVAMGTKYYDQLVDQYKVEGTPTVVVVNSATKKSQKLEGTSEISQANVLKAIDTLSTSR